MDDNQQSIVQTLRAIPGVTVEPGHDDILVGYKGNTYWYEIKRPDMRRKDGGWKAKALKPSQIKLQSDWRGHYRIVCDVAEILDDLGINPGR